MVHLIACHRDHCPWRRSRTYGCTHPDGTGKIVTHKSSHRSVPVNCPLLKQPDILVPCASPRSGVFEAPLARIHRTARAISEMVARWVEVAEGVYKGSASSAERRS